MLNLIEPPLEWKRSITRIAFALAGQSNRTTAGMETDYLAISATLKCINLIEPPLEWKRKIDEDWVGMLARI